MAQLQSFRQFTNAHLVTSRKAPDGQQGLVLLRRNPGRFRSFLAESQELPQSVAERGGAKLGDFAVVMNLRNGKSSFAIYADIGTLGEGSVALAEALGISSDARDGGASDDVLYLLFPGSGNRKPRMIGEIQSEGEKLVYRWGGMKNLSSCVESRDPAVESGEF